MRITTFIIQKTGLTAAQLFGGANPLVLIMVDTGGRITIPVCNVEGVTAPTDAEIAAALAAPEPGPSVADLVAYAATARAAAATAGIAVGGINIATDASSQSIITGAYCSTLIDPNYTTPWKAADGTWTTLTAAQIVAVATAVSAHVKACFAAEQACDAAIKATPPTITTTAQIDSAFAAVTP